MDSKMHSRNKQPIRDTESERPFQAIRTQAGTTAYTNASPFKNPQTSQDGQQKKHSFVRKRYLTENNSNCSASARQLKEDKRKYNVHMNCFLIVANEVCTATHSTSDTTNGPMFQLK